jgi:hypothetical protein
MSLDRVGSRKRKIEKPEPEETPDSAREENDASGNGPGSMPIATPAIIPEEKAEGLRQLFQTLNQGGAQKLSMSDVLSMDLESKGMADVLAIPIGGSEHDMYRMLERCRLTNYQKGLYCDGIHQAQHGFGWKQKFPNGEEIDLDFAIPIMGESIVNRMRASVSVEGQSLEVFERTTSTWLQRLYEAERQNQLQSRRGIQQ